MGKILRIGTAPNYSFQETSAYDANAPAATRSAWSDSAAMDQEFTEPAFTTVTAEGAVVTFLRLPDIFYGAMVKLRPDYDTSTGEAPAFQLWTHESGGDWTLRRNIALANVFVGIPSGVSKVLDLTFFPGLEDVDEVWLTMNPGPTGSPSLEFISIQLYGQCEAARRQDTSGPTPLCQLDPNDPLYTGFDEQGNPCSGTTFGPPGSAPPDLDLCNPVSIQQYRDFIADIPGFLDIFDAWLASNGANIAQFCSGITNTPPSPPSPPGSPPALPPLDVCNQDSVDAFRAAVSGDATHLAQFDAYMDSLATSGFLELTCPEEEPDEVYLDPNTLDPAPEPDTDNNTPFGTGPGGQPVFPRPADRQGPNRQPVDPDDTTDSEYHFLFMPGSFAETFLLNNLSGQPQVIQDAVTAGTLKLVSYGSDASPSIGNTTTAFARLDDISFQFTNLTPGAVVGVQTYWGNSFSPTASSYVAGNIQAYITATGYGTASGGGISAQFANATPAFGAEQVVVNGALAGHRTFLRAEGSASMDTLSFNMTGTTGFTDGTQAAYVDKLLATTTFTTAPLMEDIGQTSAALYGFYIHMVIRHPTYLSGAGVFGAPTAVGSANGVFTDNRPLVLGGTFCGINTCSTV